MITFCRDGKTVRCNVDSGLPYKDGKKYHVLYWDCGDDREDFAELLATHMHERLTGALRQIRRSAYEAGWKDAKSKKRGKRTSFFGNLTPPDKHDDVGY